jgi:ElaA protein
VNSNSSGKHTQGATGDRDLSETERIRWNCLEFEDLRPSQLRKIYEKRAEVFVVEQQISYVDPEDADEQAFHLMGFVRKDLIAYARIFSKDLRYAGATSFGRVLVSRGFRNRGYGRALTQQTLKEIRAFDSISPVVISAQAYLEKFYLSFGFKTASEPYVEEGILHIKMKLA